VNEYVDACLAVMCLYDQWIYGIEKSWEGEEDCAAAFNFTGFPWGLACTWADSIGFWRM
jgi:hypothetical protein